jgi:hypothetical protein
MRVEGSGVLAKKFNVLLGLQAGFVDCLATFASTFCELLALVLNFAVKAFENR